MSEKILSICPFLKFKLVIYREDHVTRGVVIRINCRFRKGHIMTDDELRELLIQAQDYILECEMKQLAELNLDYHEFSPKFERRMQRTIDRCIRWKKVRRIIQKLKKVLL